MHLSGRRTDLARQICEEFKILYRKEQIEVSRCLQALVTLNQENKTQLPPSESIPDHPNARFLIPSLSQI